VDDQTGISYEHRRGWISDKIKALSETFAIDVAAYAVMSNHYHIVLRVDQEQAESWTPLEVIERWNTFFTLPVLISRFMKDECATSAELKTVNEIIEKWRTRLHDISWFMRLLNESIARESNKEDNVTGPGIEDIHNFIRHNLPLIGIFIPEFDGCPFLSLFYHY